jgi:hypothetical protein
MIGFWQAKGMGEQQAENIAMTCDQIAPTAASQADLFQDSHVATEHFGQNFSAIRPPLHAILARIWGPKSPGVVPFNLGRGEIFKPPIMPFPQIPMHLKGRQVPVMVGLVQDADSGL